MRKDVCEPHCQAPTPGITSTLGNDVEAWAEDTSTHLANAEALDSQPVKGGVTCELASEVAIQLVHRVERRTTMGSGVVVKARGRTSGRGPEKRIGGQASGRAAPRFVGFECARSATLITVCAKGRHRAVDTDRGSNSSTGASEVGVGGGIGRERREVRRVAGVGGYQKREERTRATEQGDWKWVREQATEKHEQWWVSTDIGKGGDIPSPACHDIGIGKKEQIHEESPCEGSSANGQRCVEARAQEGPT